MENVQALILRREDLMERFKDKESGLIEISDFKIEYDHILAIPIVLFIDDDGNTRILKNRYGGKDMVESQYKGVDFVMPFGKHKGETLGQIMDNNPSYIAWLSNNDIIKIHDSVLEAAIYESISPDFEDLHNDWGCRD